MADEIARKYYHTRVVMVYKYSMIMRDMVKLFPRGDLEPMAYFPETQSRENRPWLKITKGK